MRSLRILAGWLCILAGFAVMVLMSFGVFDPARSPNAGDSLMPLVVGHLPSVSFGIAIFAIGVWLISTGKRR